MRAARPTSSYARDYRRIEKRGLDIGRLDVVIEILCTNGILPPTFRPHKLHGDWAGYWECHIGNDWLLVYVVTDREVILYRTGSHTDIFE